VYGEAWTAVLDEQLLHERELENIVGPDFYIPQVYGVYKSMVDQYTITWRMMLVLLWDTYTKYYILQK